MSEEYKVYLRKFKIAVSIFVGSIVVFGFILSKVIPEINKISDIQNEYKTQTSALSEAERKLQGLKDTFEAKKIENENLPKAFFKPINGGNDTETVIFDEFGEILQIIRENKIKTRSIKYEYDPQDDNFVKNVANRYHVCRITAEMITNYSNFENFMRELYKHEHFLDIAKVEIVPYEKNKRILLVNLQIKLYASKDTAGIVEAPVQSQEQTADNNAEKMPDIAPELNE